MNHLMTSQRRSIYDKQPKITLPQSNANVQLTFERKDV